MMTRPIHRLIYSSRIEIAATGQARRFEIEQFLAVARRNNQRAGITGALLVNNTAFIQILEGPLEAVKRTFERISRDSRHGRMMILESRAVEERGFPDMPMVLIDATDIDEDGPAFGPLAISELGLFEAIRRHVHSRVRLVA